MYYMWVHPNQSICHKQKKHELAWSRYIQWRQAWVKGVGELLVLFSLFFNIYFFCNRFFCSLFFYSKVELTSAFLFLSKMIIGVYGTLGLSPSSPTLGLLCESQVCRIRVSLPKIIKACGRCNSHVSRHRMSLFFLILTWKGLTHKNTQRCILTW
jgi:hypothetical protein